MDDSFFLSAFLLSLISCLTFGSARETDPAHLNACTRSGRVDRTGPDRTGLDEATLYLWLWVDNPRSPGETQPEQWFN